MKEIKYKGRWYAVGDKILIIRDVPLLFFWSRKKDVEHVVSFIGDDCGAQCVTQDENVYGKEFVITGSVRYI